MKSKLNGIITVLLLFLVQISFAQVKTISGTLTDKSGLSIFGVNIIIKGSTTGSETDADGKYSVQAKIGDVLQYSFVGMETQERTVGILNEIDVILISNNILAEVVILGYTTTLKKKSSVASTTIEATTIENRPNASFVQTLSGQVSGLYVNTISGQPGANSTIRIRGISSINGNTEPLFIIDGAPVDQDNFRSLNPNEIASISVLKDAGATAIYGNRGANGVIIITTKSGSFDTKMEIGYMGLFGLSQLQNNSYNLMDSQEQLQLEKLVGLGLGATLSDAEINDFTTTEWLDVFFRTAQSKSHTLTISNGSENLKSFVSFGFLEQEGILIESDLKRFNIRSNINGKSKNDKFNYGLNLSINYSENNEPDDIGTGSINTNFIFGANSSVPYISPDDYTNGAALVSPLLFRNTPLFLIDLQETFKRTKDELKIIASLNASYKLTDNFTLKGVWSADYQDEVLVLSATSDSFNALLFGGGREDAGWQENQYTRTFSFNQVLSLNYHKEFGKHTFDATIFTEYFKAHFQDFGFFENGLNIATFDHGDGSAFINDNADNDFYVDTVNANILEAGLFSYFTQVDYDYETRFGFTGTVRRDASYRFSESNRWGTFFSVAARWNISNESFMEDSAFDVLKLRGSYGTAGNQNINGSGPFESPDLTRDLYATGTGYGGNNSLFLSQIGNSTLKWETVKSANLGIDIEVFSKRLRFSMDAYIKITEDLYQNTPVSAINSVNNLSANIGELQNKGVDLSINYDLLKGGENAIKLTLNFVGNYNKTEITDLPGDLTELLPTGRVGGKLFEYFVYRFAGVNPANGELLFLTAEGELTENPNVDTDRVWLSKNIFPDYQGSFGFDADYKGFFITTQFNYVVGVDRIDFGLGALRFNPNIGQFRTSRDLLRAWTPENRITDIPSLTASNASLSVGSDRYLTSADYLRLRYAQIGFVFPQNLLKNIGFSTIKIFASAENLFTITKWRGYDAEAASNNGRLYPTPKTVSLGVEFTF